MRRPGSVPASASATISSSVDLQEHGGLGGREHVGQLGGRERVVADGHAPVRELDRDAARRGRGRGGGRGPRRCRGRRSGRRASSRAPSCWWRAPRRRGRACPPRVGGGGRRGRRWGGACVAMIADSYRVVLRSNCALRRVRGGRRGAVEGRARKRVGAEVWRTLSRHSAAKCAKLRRSSARALLQPVRERSGRDVGEAGLELRARRRAAARPRRRSRAPGARGTASRAPPRRSGVSNSAPDGATGSAPRSSRRATIVAVADPARVVEQRAGRAAADVAEEARSEQVDHEVEVAAERGEDQRLLGVGLAARRAAASRGARRGRPRRRRGRPAATDVSAPSSASSAARSSRLRRTAFW